MAAQTGKEDKTILLDKSTHQKVLIMLSSERYEEGGIIGIENGVISHFEKDITPLLSSERCYIPNTEYLEGIIDAWVSKGIGFAGIIHSHLKSPYPSNEDLDFVRETISLNILSDLTLGIVLISDSTLHLYSVTKNDFTKLEYKIL